MPSPRAKSQVKSHQRLKTLSLFFSGQCSLVQRPTCSGIRELNERMKDREREREKWRKREDWGKRKEGWSGARKRLNPFQLGINASSSTLQLRVIPYGLWGIIRKQPFSSTEYLRPSTWYRVKIGFVFAFARKMSRPLLKSLSYCELMIVAWKILFSKRNLYTKMRSILDKFTNVQCSWC